MHIVKKVKSAIKHRLIRKITWRLNKYNKYKDVFHDRTGKKLDLDNPQYLNEKILWLYLFWQNPLIVKCADKLRVKDYLKENNLEELIVPTISIYENAKDIDFDKLPNSFVLKCNHGSAYNIVVPDKSKLNKEDAIKKLNKWKKEDFGSKHLEYHYSKMKPEIYAEEYLDLTSGGDIVDYKLHCINGEPYAFQIYIERIYINGEKGSRKPHSYSPKWERLDLLKDEASHNLPKPKRLEDMINYARILAKPFPYVRIDFYEVGNRIYLGEMTFTPTAFGLTYYKDSVLKEMGDKLILPEPLKEKVWY